jgi:hypothetical protein
LRVRASCQIPFAVLRAGPGGSQMRDGGPPRRRFRRARQAATTCSIATLCSGGAERASGASKATFCDAHHIAGATDTLEAQIG